MTRLEVSVTDKFDERLERFHLLSPEERKESAMWGKPGSMCNAGAYLFPLFCDDPQENKTFLEHTECCEECRSSFLVWLGLVADGD